MIERLAQSVSDSIGNTLGYDEEKKEIIQYGAFALFHTLWSFIVVFVIGYILGLFLEVVFISVISAGLRKFSGGAHCTSPNRCSYGGTIIFILLALFVHLFTLYGSYTFYYLYLGIGFIFCIGIMIRYCPVGSINKPIKLERTKRRLRRSTFIFIVMGAIAAAMLVYIGIGMKRAVYINISMAVVTGMIWQSFTLVPAGHGFTEWYDHILKYIIKG